MLRCARQRESYRRYSRARGVTLGNSSEQVASPDGAGILVFSRMLFPLPAQQVNCGVRVRHDVAVLRLEDEPTAPAVMPAVS